MDHCSDRHNDQYSEHRGQGRQHVGRILEGGAEAAAADTTQPAVPMALEVPPELTLDDEGTEGGSCGTVPPDQASATPGWDRFVRNLGVEAIRREHVDGMTWHDDQRGSPFVNEDLLRRLNPVVAEVARGHVGLLAATGVNDATRLQVTAVASPVLLALLDDEKDGAAEVLLADLAASNQALAGTVVRQLQEFLLRGGSVEKAKLLMRLHVNLTRGMESALANLGRFRALRRGEAGEIDMKVRALGSEEQTGDEITSAH